MYDDQHVYSNAGAFKASAGGAAKAPKESLAHRNQAGADSFDNDSSTTSMYDDQHVYSNAGAFKAAAGGAAKAPVEGLVQHRLRSRDTYDFDPTTTSMYDDGDQIKNYNAGEGLGSLTWKFAGGPKAEYDAAKAAKKKPEPTETLTQFARKDSFDADPTTASMYDDGDKVKTYNQKGLGSLNWKFAGGPKAEYDAAKAAQAETLSQYARKDSFDADPTTVSMFDDGDKVKTYNQKGLGSLNWKFAGGPKAEYDAAKAA